MKLPQFRPMLPTSEPLAAASGYVHEIKWDGFRALAYLAEQVSLVSRGGSVLNDRFSAILPELAKLGRGLVLDGEIVALNRAGKPEFSLLKTRGEAPLVYIVFDILLQGGKSLCPQPWRKRRVILESVVATGKNILLSPLLPGTQADSLMFAEREGLEGIISKKVDSPYLPGRRSSFWRKHKIIKDVDCVVVGVNRVNGRCRSFLAALYTADQTLLYVGSVGSGLGGRELAFLKEAASRLGQAACPVVNPPRPQGSISWFRPHLVAKVQYLEFTPGCKLRHPVFLQFRFDKKAAECVFGS